MLRTFLSQLLIMLFPVFIFANWAHASSVKNSIQFADDANPIQNYRYRLIISPFFREIANLIGNDVNPITLQIKIEPQNDSYFKYDVRNRIISLYLKDEQSFINDKKLVISLIGTIMAANLSIDNPNFLHKQNWILEGIYSEVYNSYFSSSYQNYYPGMNNVVSLDSNNLKIENIVNINLPSNVGYAIERIYESECRLLLNYINNNTSLSSRKEYISSIASAENDGNNLSLFLKMFDNADINELNKKFNKYAFRTVFNENFPLKSDEIYKMFEFFFDCEYKVMVEEKITTKATDLSKLPQIWDNIYNRQEFINDLTAKNKLLSDVSPILLKPCIEDTLKTVYDFKNKKIDNIEYRKKINENKIEFYKACKKQQQIDLLLNKAEYKYLPLDRKYEFFFKELELNQDRKIDIPDGLKNYIDSY